MTLLPNCVPEGRHPTREELATIVVSGGGRCITPAQGARDGGADLAIAGPSAHDADPLVQRLLAAEVSPLVRVTFQGCLARAWTSHSLSELGMPFWMPQHHAWQHMRERALGRQRDRCMAAGPQPQQAVPLCGLQLGGASTAPWCARRAEQLTKPVQVPCASAQLLVQWLSQPAEDLAPHLLFGRTQLSPRLASAAAARRDLQPPASLLDELTDLQ